MIITLIIHYPI